MMVGFPVYWTCNAERIFMSESMLVEEHLLARAQSQANYEEFKQIRGNTVFNIDL